MLTCLGSLLSLGSLPLATVAEGSSGARDSTSDYDALIDINGDVVRKALRQLRLCTVELKTISIVQAYLLDPGSAVSTQRLQHRIHSDFVAGQTTTLDGWVISEAELVLLASISVL